MVEEEMKKVDEEIGKVAEVFARREGVSETGEGKIKISEGVFTYLSYRGKITNPIAVRLLILSQ